MAEVVVGGGFRGFTILWRGHHLLHTCSWPREGHLSSAVPQAGTVWATYGYDTTEKQVWHVWDMIMRFPVLEGAQLVCDTYMQSDGRLFVKSSLILDPFG